MSVDEILSEMAAHMTEGIMIHETLMNGYLFLGLPGYSACHKHHYLSETNNYIKLRSFQTTHTNTIIRNTFKGSSVPDIIPRFWYDYDRGSLPASVRKDAIKSFSDIWVDWETDTRDEYSVYYTELLSLGDVTAAEFVKNYILDVEEELSFAKDERLKLQSTDFDIVFIMEEQKLMEEKWKS